MTIEQSHGKARPTLPRSSDLEPIRTERERDADRQPGGRWAHGNKGATGRAWKAAIKAGLPKSTADTVLDELARQSWTLYAAMLREMPSDGPTVRSHVMQVARSTALATYYANRAAEVGLETKEGMALDERSMKHGARAERVSVTAFDIATKQAKRKDSVIDFDAISAAFGGKPNVG